MMEIGGLKQNIARWVKKSIRYVYGCHMAFKSSLSESNFMKITSVYDMVQGDRDMNSKYIYFISDIMLCIVYSKENISNF